MDHVVSQMPYAIFSGGIAALGFLVVGLTESLVLAFAVQILALVLSAILFRISAMRRSNVKKIDTRRRTVPGV